MYAGGEADAENMSFAILVSKTQPNGTSSQTELIQH